MLLKWLRVLTSNKTKNIQVAQLWEVRWNAVEFNRLWDYEHSCEHRPQVETFLTEEDATQFKESLEVARSLLRIKGATRITIRKAP